MTLRTRQDKCRQVVVTSSKTMNFATSVGGLGLAVQSPSTLIPPTQQTPAELMIPPTDRPDSSLSQVPPEVVRSRSTSEPGEAQDDGRTLSVDSPHADSNTGEVDGSPRFEPSFSRAHHQEGGPRPRISQPGTEKNSDYYTARTPGGGRNAPRDTRTPVQPPQPPRGLGTSGLQRQGQTDQPSGEQLGAGAGGGGDDQR
jgi:hypothetical protein